MMMIMKNNINAIIIDNKNKHNAELQSTDPDTKDTENSIPGAVFSHTIPKNSHCFGWEKTNG